MKCSSMCKKHLYKSMKLLLNHRILNSNAVSSLKSILTSLLMQSNKYVSFIENNWFDDRFIGIISTKSHSRKQHSHSQVT